MTDKRILIAEDEGIIARDIQNVLEGFGYHIPSIASSGEEAVAKAAALNPDLILMDIRLQGNLDGIEAVRQIRKTQNVPIIYLTVYTDNATLERVKATEPSGYILKPYKETELHIMIQMALHSHGLKQKLHNNQNRIEKELRETKGRYELMSCIPDVVHELRNAIHAVKMVLSSIKRINDTPAMNTCLTHIDSQMIKANQIITYLAKQNQFSQLKCASISILDILDDCTSTCLKKYENSNVVIQKEYQCNQSDLIQADPFHIQQIFDNILDNAYQTIRETKGHITVAVLHKKEEGCFEILFRNDGDSIPPDDLSRVFDPFFTTKPNHIGLGLNTCRQLINVYNGKISVQSVEEGDTTVVVQIPTSMDV